MRREGKKKEERSKLGRRGQVSVESPCSRRGASNPVFWLPCCFSLPLVICPLSVSLPPSPSPQLSFSLSLSTHIHIFVSPEREKRTPHFVSDRPNLCSSPIIFVTIYTVVFLNVFLFRNLLLSNRAGRMRVAVCVAAWLCGCVAMSRDLDL